MTTKETKLIKLASRLVSEKATEYKVPKLEILGGERPHKKLSLEKRKLVHKARHEIFFDLVENHGYPQYVVANAFNAHYTTVNNTVLERRRALEKNS